MTIKPLLMAFAIISSFACSKSKDSNSTSNLPLKAVPSVAVNGLVLTLTADKSQGDVCAYGWQMSTGGTGTGHVTYSPSSSQEGTKNPDGTYVSGTCKYIPIVATLTDKGAYVFSLAVYDKDKKVNWADINVEIK